MTLYARIITLAAILVALAVGVQAQTPEIDALRARAEQGDAEAQTDLGDRYFAGNGVPQDDAEAVRWYRWAAEQGNANAQFNLGWVYWNGRGVPQDAPYAYAWINLAAAGLTGERRVAARSRGISADRGRSGAREPAL